MDRPHRSATSTEFEINLIGDSRRSIVLGFFLFLGDGNRKSSPFKLESVYASLSLLSKLTVLSIKGMNDC